MDADTPASLLYAELIKYFGSLPSELQAEWRIQDVVN